jgi:hypothetical protein
VTLSPDPPQLTPVPIPRRDLESARRLLKGSRMVVNMLDRGCLRARASTRCGNWTTLAALAAALILAPSTALAQTDPLPPLPPPDDPSASTPPASTATPTSSPQSPPPPSTPSAASTTPEESTEPTPPPPTSQRALSAWATNPLGIEANLGLGTPLGFLGVALDYAVLPTLSLNAGLGIGGAGPQGAVSARFRIPVFTERFAPYLGVGLSGGPYTPGTFCIPAGDGDCDTSPFHWNTAYWANFEAGTEWRTRSNITFRTYTGLAWMLNSGDAQSSEPRDVAGAPGDQWLFYFGGAIGYAIGL